MRDYLSIGSAPPAEKCAQVGSRDYEEVSLVECRTYARMLKRLFPLGDFHVKSFPHDFGSYREVVAFFDTDAQEDDPYAQAAYDAEGKGPENWDEEARRELEERLPGYFSRQT